MSDALTRARADLAAGRPWMARSRLHGALTNRQDPEILDLLATIHHQMHDLPAAGALWFVLDRTDDDARQAIDAWMRTYRNDIARWHSIPAPVRRHVDAKPLEVLRSAAKQADKGGTRDLEPHTRREEWWEPIVFGGCCLTVVILVLALLVIGIWTAAHWLWS